MKSIFKYQLKMHTILLPLCTYLFVICGGLDCIISGINGNAINYG